jgi:hypothetical protein
LISNLVEVTSTHAVADGRVLIHRQWLDEFLKRAGIGAVYSYRPPPFGEQLPLPLP